MNLRQPLVTIVVAGLLGPLAIALTGQSLGDIARKEREKKAAEQKDTKQKTTVIETDQFGRPIPPSVLAAKQDDVREEATARAGLDIIQHLPQREATGFQIALALSLYEDSCKELTGSYVSLQFIEEKRTCRNEENGVTVGPFDVPTIPAYKPAIRTPGGVLQIVVEPQVAGIAGFLVNGPNVFMNPQAAASTRDTRLGRWDVLMRLQQGAAKQR